MSYLCIVSSLYYSVKKSKLLLPTLLDYLDTKKPNIWVLYMDIYELSKNAGINLAKSLLKKKM